MARWYLQHLAHGRICAAFTQHGEYQLVHDAIVETIARYADPGGPKRYAALRRARRLDPHNGKIARTAPEVGDQQGCGFSEPRGEAESRPQWFVNIMHFPLEGREHEVVALAGEPVVRPLPRIANRAANNDARRQQLQCIGRTCPQPLQKNMAQLLEAQSLVENGCMLERPACSDGLEGLQETAALREIQKLGDGPWSCFPRNAARHAAILPEAKRGAKDGTGIAGRRVIDQPCATVRIAQCHNGIGCSKVDPD